MTSRRPLRIPHRSLPMQIVRFSVLALHSKDTGGPSVFGPPKVHREKLWYQTHSFHSVHSVHSVRSLSASSEGSLSESDSTGLFWLSWFHSDTALQQIFEWSKRFSLFQAIVNRFQCVLIQSTDRCVCGSQTFLIKPWSGRESCINHFVEGPRPLEWPEMARFILCQPTFA